MANHFFSELFHRIKALLSPGTRPGSEETQVKFARKEKIIVFVAAYIMAVSLWFIVNLNGNFNITLNIPIEKGSVPQDKALTEQLPEFVQVGLSGDGWILFNLYNDPPTVSINVAQGEINLFDQIRQRLNYLQDVDVTKVQPLVLSIDLDNRISKKVPVVLDRKLNFQNRYGMVGEARLVPDSITVTGARSIIEQYSRWKIPDTLRLNGIKNDIDVNIPVKSHSPLVEVSEESINFRANVSEFTEGETTVYIQTLGLPRGENINYTPSAVTIRYNVPLEQYAEVSKIQPYKVYVPYQKILEDSSGYVTPDVELTATQYNLKLRSFQPKAVAYFSVLNQ